MSSRRRTYGHIMSQTGSALPGVTLVCGDSHTATNGALSTRFVDADVVLCTWLVYVLVTTTVTSCFDDLIHVSVTRLDADTFSARLHS